MELLKSNYLKKLYIYKKEINGLGKLTKHF